jgi:hypothetical protein
MNQVQQDFVNTNPEAFSGRETASESPRRGPELSPLAFVAIVNVFAVIVYGLMKFYSA